jgi:hypothetical protein
VTVNVGGEGGEEAELSAVEADLRRAPNTIQKKFHAVLMKLMNDSYLPMIQSSYDSSSDEGSEESSDESSDNTDESSDNTDESSDGSSDGSTDEISDEDDERC